MNHLTIPLVSHGYCTRSFAKLAENDVVYIIKVIIFEMNYFIWIYGLFVLLRWQDFYLKNLKQRKFK